MLGRRCSLRSLSIAAPLSSSTLASSSRSALLLSYPHLRPFSSSSSAQALGGLYVNSQTLISSSAALPPNLISKPAKSGPPTRRQRRTAEKKARAAQKKKDYQNTRAAQLGLSQAKVSPYVRIDRQFKTFKPLTPSLRWLRYNVNDHLHGGRPERSLTIAKRSTGGRNHHGKITVRGRGGGHRRRLRMVDFWRWEAGPQDVVRIEYDPGRSAHIALVKHIETQRLSYILAPDGIRAGDVVQSYRTTKEIAGSTGEGGVATSLDLGLFRTKAIRPGNALPLHLIPIGTMIHAISLNPIGPAKLVRSAGASGQLVAFVKKSKALKPSATSDGVEAQADSEFEVAMSPQVASSAAEDYAQVKLQSGEVRLVPAGCVATVGRVSNIDHQHVRLGKAGRSRWLGRRPKVRGVAMNAVDHPHGGGRGKSKSNMHPRSIYNHVQGMRTRKPGTRGGNRLVIRERPRQNGKRAGK